MRTPAGSGLWLRVESFRRFLAESEAYHAEEAAKRGVLREYTAWAVALGEIDRWSRAVSASTVIPETAGSELRLHVPVAADLDRRRPPPPRRRAAAGAGSAAGSAAARSAAAPAGAAAAAGDARTADLTPPGEKGARPAVG